MQAIEELLADHDPEVRELVMRAVDFVRGALPEAEIRVWRGWGGAGFIDPSAGYVCGVFPRSDHVRLLFEHGALLPDPEGLLRGEGSQTRYVPMDCWDPGLETGLLDLVDAAASLRSTPGRSIDG